MEYLEQDNLLTSGRKIFSRIGLACFAILVIASVLQLASIYLTSQFKPGWAEQPLSIWAITFIPLYAIGVPAGILIFNKIPADRTYTRRLRFKDLLIFLIMCFPVMYIGNIIGTLLNNGLHALLGTETKNPLDLFTNSTNIWLSVLFLVILAPVIEEFIFRKLIIDRVRPYGEGACVLISGLLFGLFHGNFNQVFYAFGLGAIFAFIYVKTGKLRYTIFLHMFINLYSGVLAPLLVKALGLSTLTAMNKTDPQEMMRYVLEHMAQIMILSLYGMINLALVVAGIVLLIARRRAFYFEHGPLQPVRGTRFKTLFLNPGMILFAVGALALFVLSLF